MVISESELQRIRSVADYQFGKGVGSKLFTTKVVLTRSKRTGRIRYIYLDGKRLATLRPTDGLFSLSIAGARRILANANSVKYLVVVCNDVGEYISKGGNVFAKHVVEADINIRLMDEVMVVDEERNILAVGRAALSGHEMLVFKIGLAVKVRHGLCKRVK